MGKPLFDAASYMEQQGLKFVGASADDPTFETSEGERVKLDVMGYLRSEGVPVDKLDLQLNTPDQATEVSPIGIMDRLRLTAGNAQGKMAYLKNKFEDVKYDPNKGLVAKNKGVWQAIDPSGLGDGDAWEMTKEVLKDAVDLTDIAGSAVLSGFGAAGGAVAGPAGAIAGAGAGGALAEGIRTSLGRLAGTYKATPEEQIKDIAIEAVLNLGGETVALGVKPGLKMLGNAFKGLKLQAAETSLDILSETLGRVNGAGPQATRTMIDQTDDVVKEMTKAKAGNVTLNEAVETLRSSQLKVADEILEEAPKALTQRFGQLKAQLIKDAASMPNVNVGKLAEDSLASLEEAGILRKVINEKTGKAAFKVMDEDSAIALRNAGQNAEIFAPAVQAELQPIVEQFNKFTKMGEFKGQQAAANLMDLKRTINDVFRDLVGPSTPPSVERLLNTLKSDFSNRIGQVFDQAGLTPQYMSTVNIYQKYADAVLMARRMAKLENGGESFVKKLVSDNAANGTLKDLAKDMADLMGPVGAAKINSINTKEAAKAFTPWLPRTGLASQVILSASAAGAATFGPAALGAAAVTSPRLALNAVNYARKSLGLIQSLTPTQRLQFLQEPQLLENFLRTTFTATTNQELMTEELTRRATGGQ